MVECFCLCHKVIEGDVKPTVVCNGCQHYHDNLQTADIPGECTAENTSRLHAPPIEIIRGSTDIPIIMEYSSGVTTTHVPHVQYTPDNTLKNQNNEVIFYSLFIISIFCIIFSTINYSL